MNSLFNVYLENPDFKKLVDWAISRERNAWRTTLQTLERELGLSHSRCVTLARVLENLGCGKFRKGWNSSGHFEWNGGLFHVVEVLTQPAAA